MLTPYLDTTDNKFGFKKGPSISLYISLKNIIEYCRSNNSPVYVCFLDASKDTVSHWTLFRELLNRSVPVLLIHIHLIHVAVFLRRDTKSHRSSILCLYISFFVMTQEK